MRFLVFGSHRFRFFAFQIGEVHFPENSVPVHAKILHIRWAKKLKRAKPERTGFIS